MAFACLRTNFFLLEQIFEHVDDVTMTQSVFVCCRQWKEHFERDAVWELRFKRRFGTGKEVKAYDLFKELSWKTRFCFKKRNDSSRCILCGTSNIGFLMGYFLYIHIGNERFKIGTKCGYGSYIHCKPMEVMSFSELKRQSLSLLTDNEIRSHLTRIYTPNGSRVFYMKEEALIYLKKKHGNQDNTLIEKVGKYQDVIKEDGYLQLKKYQNTLSTWQNMLFKEAKEKSLSDDKLFCLMVSHGLQSSRKLSKLVLDESNAKSAVEELLNTDIHEKISQVGVVPKIKVLSSSHIPTLEILTDGSFRSLNDLPFVTKNIISRTSTNDHSEIANYAMREQELIDELDKMHVNYNSLPICSNLPVEMEEYIMGSSQESVYFIAMKVFNAIAQWKPQKSTLNFLQYNDIDLLRQLRDKHMESVSLSKQLNHAVSDHRFKSKICGSFRVSCIRDSVFEKFGNVTDKQNLPKKRSSPTAISLLDNQSETSKQKQNS